MKSMLAATFCTILFAGALAVASPLPAGQATATAPDNTKMNKRDRAKGKLTADQQGQSISDRDTSRKIRQSLLQDKSLSLYAHNVKIITREGTVTLRGPVRSAEEKEAVVEKAKEIVKFIKESKHKVQGSIQGDLVRVSGKDRDTLQAIIAAVRQKDFGIDLQFINFRSN